MIDAGTPVGRNPDWYPVPRPKVQVPIDPGNPNGPSFTAYLKPKKPSKYVPHQGVRECAKRRAKMEKLNA